MSSLSSGGLMKYGKYKVELIRMYFDKILMRWQ